MFNVRIDNRDPPSTRQSGRSDCSVGTPTAKDASKTGSVGPGGSDEAGACGGFNNVLPIERVAGEDIFTFAPVEF